MAIGPGNKFILGDLTTLTTLANGRSSTHYDLTHFFDVSPMGTDNTGQDYGYRICSGFSITTMGINYVPGDIVTIPGGAVTAEVVAVNAAGGILGLLIQTTTSWTPATSGSDWETANDPTLGGLTGGHGSGAVLTFGVAHVGPGAGYAMPDYTPGTGTITNILSVAAGAGYQIGDALTLAGLPLITVNVTAVDLSGAITAFELSGTSTSTQIPASVAALAASGGHGGGATFEAQFILPQKPTWLTELNRLRGNLYNVPGLMTPSLQLAVSGPWPVAAPDPNYKYNNMYFPASASTIDVTMSVNIPGILSTQNAYVFHGETQVSTSGGVNPPELPARSWFYGTITTTSSPDDEALGIYTVQTGETVLYDGTTYPGDTTYSQPPLGNQACVIGENTMTLIIGGGSPVLVQGTFYMEAQYFCGMTGTRTDGGTLSISLTDMTPPSATVSGNFPGTVSIVTGPQTAATIGYGNAGGNLPYGSGFGTTSGYSWNQIIYIEINGYVAPGRYVLTITAPTFGDDSQSSTATLNADGSSSSSYSCTLQPRYIMQAQFKSGGLVTSFTSGWPIISGTATASKVINTGAVAAPGIHNTETVWRLPLDWDVNGVSAIAGQVVYTQLPFAAPWNTTELTYYGPPSSWLQAWQTPPYYPGRDQMFGWSLSSLPSPVLWSAQTPPASNLHIASGAQMPWNLYRTKPGTGGTGNATVNPALLGDLAPNVSGVAQVSNSYDPDGSHKLVEAQLEPASWLAHRYFTAGFTILDINSNYQQVITAGISGTSAPAWCTSVAQITTDGSVSWKCVKLMSAHSITSAQHRIPNIPRFPIYWASETLASLMPPTSTSGLTIWGAYNQWTLNVWARDTHGNITGFDPSWQSVSSSDSTGMAFGWFIYSISINRMVSGGSISCTIGCMRSGVFTPFETFVTGFTYQVIWPIFTSNALVYQATERLDIQAVAISNGGVGVSLGATVSSPGLIAAFVADTESILSLIT